jgi:RNA polymerase sigma-70 factor (ECF subfamily)
MRRIETYDRRSSPKTWLYGICIRTASEYRRRAVNRREVVSEAGPDATVGPSQEEATALRQARVVLDRILDGLDIEKREIFVLYEIEELTMPEVASAVGCPLQTAYSRYRTARIEVEAALHRLEARRARE